MVTKEVKARKVASARRYTAEDTFGQTSLAVFAYLFHFLGSNRINRLVGVARFDTFGLATHDKDSFHV